MHVKGKQVDIYYKYLLAIFQLYLFLKASYSLGAALLNLLGSIQQTLEICSISTVHFVNFTLMQT